MEWHKHQNNEGGEVIVGCHNPHRIKSAPFHASYVSQKNRTKQRKEVVASKGRGGSALINKRAKAH